MQSDNEIGGFAEFVSVVTAENCNEGDNLLCGIASEIQYPNTSYFHCTFPFVDHGNASAPYVTDR